MSDSTTVWFITGAARGMGVELANAALDAGHSVVATARDAAKVTAALGEHDRLLAVPLDITDLVASTSAVEATISRFGGIDVLVNNAGDFYSGYFGEISVAAWKGMDGRQDGDPAKLGRALVEIVALDDPPLRWIAGADALGAVEQKAHELMAQADAHRALSSSLDHDA